MKTTYPILAICVGFGMSVGADIQIDETETFGPFVAPIAKDPNNPIWLGTANVTQWDSVAKEAAALAAHPDKTSPVMLNKVTLDVVGSFVDPTATLTANTANNFFNADYNVSLWATVLPGGALVNHKPAAVPTTPQMTLVGGDLKQRWIGDAAPAVIVAPFGFAVAAGGTVQPFPLDPASPINLPGANLTDSAMVLSGDPNLGDWIGAGTVPIQSGFGPSATVTSSGDFAFSQNPLINMEYNVTYDWKYFIPDQVIPEPSVYGAGALIACIGLAVYRRRLAARNVVTEA